MANQTSKKKEDYKDSAERLAAAIVATGSLEAGAALIRSERVLALRRAQIPIQVTTEIPRNASKGVLGKSGGYSGDGLVEIRVQGGPIDIAIKLRELASFYSGMSADIDGATILILTNSRLPSPEEMEGPA